MLRRLEDHLWRAADLFRNKVSNQKDYSQDFVNAARSEQEKLGAQLAAM